MTYSLKLLSQKNRYCLTITFAAIYLAYKRYSDDSWSINKQNSAPRN